MTTAKSSFSISRFLPVYKNLLRRNRGSAFFYGVLSFMFFGLQYLLSFLEYMRYPEIPLREFTLIGPANIYNGFAVAFFTGMSLVIPLVMATNLFAYIQNKRSVDVYHSLPLTRSELYLATSAAGITLIWIPLILNFLFVAGCAILVGGQDLGMIFLELACWMVITFAIFALTAFSAVNVGTTFDTAIFSLGLNASFAAIYMLIIAIASGFLYGFSRFDDGVEMAYRLSPISLMIGRQALNNDALLRDNNIAVALWLAAGIAVFIIGLFVYKKRRSEQAESVGNLGPLQMFLRAAGTLVGGTMVGAVFCGVFGLETSKPVFLASVAVGALIVYFIGDVILTRTVRSIPKALPAAVATTLGVCLLVGSVMFGGFGYETRVPDFDSVASVTLENYESRYSDEPSLNQKYSGAYLLSEPESINLIIKAHQAQVQSYLDAKDSDNQDDDYNGGFAIRYTLKDGSTMSRQYYGLYPETRDALMQLESQPELISQTHAAFKGTADMLSDVTVTNALGTDTKVLDLTVQQKEQLLEAVRSDLLAQPVNELENGAQAMAYLEMEYHYVRDDNKEVSFEPVPVETVEDNTQAKPLNDPEYAIATSDVMITESFKNTRELLAQFGAAEQLENDFSQVKSAYVGVVGYRWDRQDMVIQQSSLDRIIDLDSLAYQRDDSEKYDAEMSKAAKSFVEINPEKLTAIRKDLTNIFVDKGDNPYVVVAIASEIDGQEAITGYYYMPLESLSEQMKYAVCESARNDYEDGWLINKGYHYFE